MNVTERNERPLEGHPVLHTRSLDEARQAVTDVYLPHQLYADDPTALDMTLNATEQRLFTAGFLTYGTNATLRMPATETCYHVNLTTAGHTDAARRDGGRETTQARQRGVILHPEQTNTVHWSQDAEQIILKVPRVSLEAHLSDLLGRKVDSVIDFDFGLDLSTAAGASLLASVEFFVGELDRPGGIADMPLARDQLEAFIMSQLLTAGDHPYKDDLLAPASQVKLGRLKPVVDFIEMNADEPLTPAELARAGSMSVRTLHASFQKCFGMSPMAYVRKVRLEHVHDELRRNSGNPDFRITDIASKWGFFHLGRFAQQYKERFGESPSETVRR
ncbi:MAG: AraC family transcriptional regulator [Rhodococcus erythropolis]|jgi:AraC-like DNA-binding protein|nr:AraC family transcriptional regulator [Rhodococcus erythropolis]